MRDSDRFELAWKFSADDFQPMGSLQAGTWPLKAGALGTILTPSSLFIRGTRDPSYPNKKRKRIEKENSANGANDKPAESADRETKKYCCAACPPALPLSNKQFQGSWGNGADIAPVDRAKFAKKSNTDWRSAAFKHSCQGGCLDLQRDLKVLRPRVSVRERSTGNEMVIETDWVEAELMQARHLQAVLDQAGPTVGAIEAVGSKASHCLLRYAPECVTCRSMAWLLISRLSATRSAIIEQLFETQLCRDHCSSRSIQNCSIGV